MLYLGADNEPLGRAKAQELLTQNPKILRHTKAWVDDSELCLEVECLLRDGATVTVKMNYCWDAPPFHGHNYFMDITEWLLNNHWLSFYEYVQARFMEVLKDHATHDYDS
jgi:hypothetical protein